MDILILIFSFLFGCIVTSYLFYINRDRLPIIFTTATLRYNKDKVGSDGWQCTACDKYYEKKDDMNEIHAKACCGKEAIHYWICKCGARWKEELDMEYCKHGVDKK